MSWLRTRSASEKDFYDACSTAWGGSTVFTPSTRLSPRRRSHDTLTFAQTQEYKRDGSVARGPAPKPLKLAKVGIDEQGQVVLEKWTEQDFRENV